MCFLVSDICTPQDNADLVFKSLNRFDVEILFCKPGCQNL